MVYTRITKYNQQQKHKSGQAITGNARLGNPERAPYGPFHGKLNSIHIKSTTANSVET